MPSPTCSNPLQPCEQRGLAQAQAEAELSASLNAAADRVHASSAKITGKFKDAHRDLQHIVRELTSVREHNLRMAAKKETTGYLLLFAEASLVLLALERFARIVMRDIVVDVNPYNLLQQAAKHKILRLSEAQIKAVNDLRNAVLHANYEQVARAENDTVAGFFQNSKFAGSIEILTLLLNDLLLKIDLETGLPKDSE